MATVLRPPEGVLKQGYIFVEAPELPVQEYFGVVVQSFLILHRSHESPISGFPLAVIDLKNTCTAPAGPLEGENLALYTKLVSTKQLRSIANVQASILSPKQDDLYGSVQPERFVIVFPDESKNVFITCPFPHEREEWSLVILTSAALAIAPSAFTLPDLRNTTLIRHPELESEIKAANYSPVPIPRSLEDDFFDVVATSEQAMSAEQESTGKGPTEAKFLPEDGAAGSSTQGGKAAAGQSPRQTPEAKLESLRKLARLRALENERVTTLTTKYVSDCTELVNRMKSSLESVQNNSEIIAKLKTQLLQEVSELKQQLAFDEARLNSLREQATALVKGGANSEFVQVDIEHIYDSVVSRLAAGCLASLSHLSDQITRTNIADHITSQDSNGPSWRERNQVLWVNLATQLLVADEFVTRMIQLGNGDLPYPLDGESAEEENEVVREEDRPVLEHLSKNALVDMVELGNRIWNWRKTLRLMVQNGYALPRIDPEVFFTLLPVSPPPVNTNSTTGTSVNSERVIQALRTSELRDILSIARIVYAVFERRVESLEYLERIQELALDGSRLLENLSR